MNRTGRMAALLGGLVLSCAAASAQTATTNLISQTTFDPSAGSAWSYGYYYGNNGLGTYAVNRSFYLPEDVDLTNGMYQYTFDATDLNATVGWGTGTGAPLFRADTDPALFASGDRSDYVLSFRARAEGLAEGQTSANAEMQVQFYRRNESAQEVNYLQVNIPFNATADWQTFTFNLGDYNLGASTLDADLALYHSETSDLRFNLNLHEPFRFFGYDADNAIYLDDAKLEVIDRGATEPTGPSFVSNILDWNMDDKGVWYEYHYDWSQNDTRSTVTGGNNANNTAPNTFGVNDSSAWYLAVDNTVFADSTPQWAGGGSGGGGPVDYAGFTSADPADYRISFDAKVFGLAEGRENTGALLQLFLETADDVIAVDEDTNADSVGRFDFPIGRITNDWQHYEFFLNKAGDAAARQRFADFHNQINGLRTQWQLENTASIADWGFDADNALYIDNIRIDRIETGAPSLVFTKEANELVLNWAAPSEGTVKLQAADTVDGTYTDLTTTGTTHWVSMDEDQKYFRLVWTAP